MSRSRRTDPGSADPQRLSALRRMKTGATALLVVAFAVYAGTYRFSGGGSGVLGFLRAAAEAGMVGGLADWFAVTALFRRPLGLPIPHTALIPRRKDAIGRSLQTFVGENFLTEDTIRTQLQAAALPARLGGWLREDAHADRVAAEAAALAASAVRLLSDADLQELVTGAVWHRLEQVSFAPQAGAVLAPLIEDGAHHPLVDLAVQRIVRWLRESETEIVELIEAQAPEWTPRFVDRSVARRLHAELTRIAGDVAADPGHRLRRQLDSFLAHLAHDLVHDPDTVARADATVHTLLQRPATRAAFGDLVSTGRALLIDNLDRPDAAIREKLSAAVREWGGRLQSDPVLGERAERAVDAAATYVVRHYRDEITRVIADTVDRWDGVETARRIEIQVGRDLQFIRINGTLVGALAGVAIHAITMTF